MIGTTISHYKILEKLGEGGMGVVYKAHDTTLDRDVALKFLPHYLTSDPTEKERFYHEAKAAAALTHTNIAVIHEIGEHDDPATAGKQVFIVMEYVDGKTLRQIIGSSTRSVKQVLDIAIQIAEGLNAAHKKGIVHRDMKPENIMLARDGGTVKIMDFGLAKLKGATKLTKAGSTLGTAAYMSPEQASGEEVDQRSDIFSFGVVLYEMLTSKLPFRGEHHAALIYSIINEQPPPIARFNERVTPELEHIVSKALAKDTDERYQHADDMLADLRTERKKMEYAKAGYVSTSTAPAVTAQPVRRFAKISVVLAALLALVVLAIVFNPFNLKIGVQQNIAEQKPSLAVMSFDNIPDPSDKDYTGEMLTNLLTTALFQVRDLDVISRERLYNIQKESGYGDTKAISPSMAEQISRRAGVSRMLFGTILQIQPSLTVTYRVVDIQTGKIISTQRLSGYKTEKIFSLVDTLAQMVKNDLNVLPTAAAPERSVMAVTTTSTDAYRAYVEGVALRNKWLFGEAITAFRKATELDSNFAMAHYQLGAIRKAWELRNNVAEKERMLSEAE